MQRQTWGKINGIKPHLLVRRSGTRRRIRIEFAPQNDFGIIDHLVTLPDGTKVNNPIRVIANGKGSELIFTLFWLPGRTEKEFNLDAKAVESDLQTLKKILEKE